MHLTYPFAAPSIKLSTTKRHWFAAFWAAHWQEGLLWLFMLAFSSYFFRISYLKQADFLTNRFDLGIMDQVVWNTAHGHFFQLTDPNGTATVSRFSIHADPFLALLAPLYLIVSSPYVILLVQSVVVALGALPLYWLGKEVLKSKWLALVVAFAYLMFPAMQRAVIFDFHSVTLATTFLLFAFYYAYKERWILFSVFSFLTMTTKETMPFLIIGLGLYIILAKRKWWVGSITIAIASLWFYILLFHIMPGSRGDGSASEFLSYYSQFGAGPEEILKNLILKPGIWINDVFNQAGLTYLLYYLVPGGFLLLLSPLVFLMALPELALNMLSGDPAMHTINFQYSSGITPFVFLALVFGLARVMTIIPWLTRRWPGLFSTQRIILGLTVYLLGWIAFSTWVWSPLPGMQDSVTPPASTNFPSAVYLNELSSDMPSDASVSASPLIASHFSEREHIYPFPLGIGQADYVIVQNQSGVLSWFTNLSSDTISQDFQSLQVDPRYEVVYQNGPISVYKLASYNPS